LVLACLKMAFVVLAVYLCCFEIISPGEGAFIENLYGIQ